MDGHFILQRREKSANPSCDSFHEWAESKANRDGAQHSIKLSAQKYGLRPDEIDDVCQEVLLACCQAQDLNWSIAWSESKDQKRFVRRLAERRCIDRRYRDQYRRRTNNLNSGDSPDTDDWRILPTADGDPSVAVELDDLCAHVDANVEALPAYYRDVVKRKFWEGQSDAEIGAAIRAPIETVRTRLKRARKLLERGLRRLLEDG